MEDIQLIRRRTLVRCAIWLTEDTSLAPSLYERELLLQFVAGTLTIDQVISLVEQEQRFRTWH